MHQTGIQIHLVRTQGSPQIIRRLRVVQLRPKGILTPKVLTIKHVGRLDYLGRPVINIINIPRGQTRRQRTPGTRRPPAGRLGGHVASRGGVVSTHVIIGRGPVIQVGGLGSGFYLLLLYL